MSIIKKLFTLIYLYTVLKQAISIICIDQMPNFRVFTKVFSVLASEFSTAQFKAGFRRHFYTHTHTHTFYSFCEFFMLTNDP